MRTLLDVEQGVLLFLDVPSRLRECAALFDPKPWRRDWGYEIQVVGDYHYDLGMGWYSEFDEVDLIFRIERLTQELFQDE